MNKKVLSYLLVLCLTLSLFSQTVAASSTGKTVDGMMGFAAPQGTIATADSFSGNYRAKNAIDGDITTRWNAAQPIAKLELAFPEPLDINFVQFATNATPAVAVEYTIFGKANDEWVKVGGPTTLNLSGTNSINPPISIIRGSYSGLKIDVNGKSSWAAINELTFGIAESIDLTAKAGDAQVALNWTPTTYTDQYIIKYGTESGKYTESITVSNIDNTYTVPNLINGTTYYFQVISIVKGREFVVSNEASATPNKETTDPTDPTNPTDPTDPTEPKGERAILVVTMVNGLEKEYDLPMSDINSFIKWYDNKDAGAGPSKFGINKYGNNKGPFKSRVDYVIFKNILTFQVDAY
ncbi:fibronectin type III domain-containing protein [Paenibacillus sp. FSL K6-1330]|uniref:fibronectin type III domain-containing protein n=1 Tax=Paenibacillus sp. FSL K6-1330 TaxID=2975292 RepID=UPI0030D93277